MKSFLNILKTVDIHTYWDSIKEVTKNLVFNDKLINILMIIILNRTRLNFKLSLYDKKMIFITLDLFEIWFDVFK